MAVMGGIVFSAYFFVCDIFVSACSSGKGLLLFFLFNAVACANVILLLYICRRYSVAVRDGAFLTCAAFHHTFYSLWRFLVLLFGRIAKEKLG